MVFTHITLSPCEVNKRMLSSIFPVLSSLKKNGVTRKRKVQCGARGKQVIADTWKWPTTAHGLLFPSPRNPSKPRGKDSVCHLICKIRKSFVCTDKTLDIKKVRSHSGRHRMVNDLKQSEASTDVAMGFARIRDKKTFDNYGRLHDHQVGHALESNRKLKKALKQTYI